MAKAKDKITAPAPLFANQVLANLRKAYGEALVEAGKKNKDVVVLEADLGKSTMSVMFKEAFPDRYFEMGIAEQNMTSTAAGFALAGKIPFTGTFAVFAAGRAYDQIRCSIAIPKANVKIIGSSCGLSDFGDGKTHQSVEDGNIIRAIPNMVVLNPVDAEEVKKMILAVIKYSGPVYIRINRNDLPVYTSHNGEYQIGMIYPITEGKDAVIFATGVMVSKSVEAAAKLKAKGISVQVLNVSTLKPMHKKEVLKYATGKKAIITAEEAVKAGGLGEAIASLVLGEINAKFEMVAINDEFGTSAHNYEELLVKYGLSANHVYKAVIKALKAK
jgi:transketolase